MHTIALVLASLACVSHARRFQPAAQFNQAASLAPRPPSRSGPVILDESGKANVVVVGAGVPKRGMGWYHAKQMMDGDVPSAKLNAVVEPWFLGAGADSPPGAAFKEWADAESKNGVGFYASVADLPKAEGKTLALISGRTADNPRLLKEVIEAGCTHVFLEKPGAPTVAELEDMKKYAAEKGVPVWMGYNKNVAQYVLDALEVQKKTEGSSMTFIHNNAYKEAELPECFERNAEGMLKNMAIHELALLATYYGVTVDNIDSVDVDKEYSSCQTLTGPGGSEFTDFAKVGFTVKTKDGKSVTVMSDRCGSDEGGNSIAIVSAGGEEKFRAETPDKDLKKVLDEKAKADPDMMPYFFLQSDDYVTLKERCTAHMVAGKEGAPEGLATLEIGIDALKVAEYLTPLLQDAALGDAKNAKATSGPESKGTPFTQEETDALYQASISKEKACDPDTATKNPSSKLLNAFTQPQIFYTLLRRPSDDPPEEVWDVIREKWPVLNERSNAELLEALAPIKAKYVDLRFL